MFIALFIYTAVVYRADLRIYEFEPERPAINMTAPGTVLAEVIAFAADHSANGMVDLFIHGVHLVPGLIYLVDAASWMISIICDS